MNKKTIMHMLSYITEKDWCDVMNKPQARAGYREVEDERIIAYEVDADSVKQLYDDMYKWYGGE